MAYKNKNKDSTAVACEIFTMLCLAGMVAFPYKAGRKFFQEYETQTAKIKGFFIASLFAMLGYFLDAIVFNILPASLAQPPSDGSFFGVLGVIVFLMLFSAGAIKGFLSKKSSK